MPIDPNQTAQRTHTVTCGPSSRSSVTITMDETGTRVAIVSLASQGGGGLGLTVTLPLAANLSALQRQALKDVIDTLHIAAATQLGFA